MPAGSEFIPHSMGEGRIAKCIGADRVFYQDLDDLVASAFGINSQINEFDCSIFDGDSVTGTLSEKYIKIPTGSLVSLGLTRSVLHEKLIETHNQE